MDVKLGDELGVLFITVAMIPWFTYEATIMSGTPMAHQHTTSTCQESCWQHWWAEQAPHHSATHTADMQAGMAHAIVQRSPRA